MVFDLNRPRTANTREFRIGGRGPQKVFSRGNPNPRPHDNEPKPDLIPRGVDHHPTSRLTKVFGPKRAPWRCGASQSVRDAVRKPW